MGTATLLTIMNDVIDELALPSITSVIGSTDDQVRQLLAYANQEGRFTSKASFGAKQGWQSLTSTFTVTMVTDTPSYQLPSDFRAPVSSTFWDVAHKWRVLSYLSPQEWDVLVYGISPTGPRVRCRIYNNLLYVNPTPGAGDNGNTLVTEYYSSNWAMDADGVTPKAKWTADTNTYRLDDDTMRLGIKWRWLRAKGMDYTEEKDQWFTQLMTAMADDSGTRDLPTNAVGREEAQLLSDSNIPDTGYGT